MLAPTPYQIKGQQMWLSADRCLFWQKAKALIVSDLHFGKTGHFRKSGIAVPQGVFQEDLQRLVSQVQYFRPEMLIFVGDLFHSVENKEFRWFKNWRENYPDLMIHLVKGNHDILDQERYAEASIFVHEDQLTMEDFQFVHDISHVLSAKVRPGGYVFSGHIHPGIRVSGPGKQSLCFPCFYFGTEYAVLPAFSKFTGVAVIEPKAGESVFAIMSADRRTRQAGGIIQIQ